ncbi:MAG TPA: hypothetical protein PK784_11065 [Tenuifilaceae bacterium]|nr:hypothetical protein [Tenuifilaceae bacterium]HPN21242.1 hypothetical protein [Tenuifilaceae bacterium]HPV57720.1 hypothetical protein [Tenuifilaceae bacterium]
MKIAHFTLCLAILLSSCTSPKSTTQESFKQGNNFAFVEYYQTSEAKVISGTIPSGKRIDSPTYHYSKENGTIESHRNLSFITDTVILVLGTGKILKGAAGSGVSSLLVGTSNLPLSYGELKIIAVSKENVKVEFKGEKITISTNSKWEKSTEYNDTINDQSAILKRTITDRISFYGFIPKDSLKN